MAEPLKNKRVQTKKRHASDVQTQSERPEPREIFTQTKVKLSNFLPLAPKPKPRVFEDLYVHTKLTEWSLGPPVKPVPSSISCQTERVVEPKVSRLEFETQTTMDTTQCETQTERASLSLGETQTDTLATGVFETQTDPCVTSEVMA